MTPFQVPDPVVKQDHVSIFEQECASGEYAVHPVNHGEFEAAVDSVLDVANKEDVGSLVRCHSLAIQRCRRGGKTFMLAAVAAQLSGRFNNETAETTHIVSISFNSNTPCRAGEDARAALCWRIAVALSGLQPDIFSPSTKMPR